MPKFEDYFKNRHPNQDNANKGPKDAYVFTVSGNEDRLLRKPNGDLRVISAFSEKQAVLILKKVDPRLRNTYVNARKRTFDDIRKEESRFRDNILPKNTKPTKSRKAKENIQGDLFDGTENDGRSNYLPM